MRSAINRFFLSVHTRSCPVVPPVRLFLLSTSSLLSIKDLYSPTPWNNKIKKWLYPQKVFFIEKGFFIESIFRPTTIQDLLLSMRSFSSVCLSVRSSYLCSMLSTFAAVCLSHLSAVALLFYDLKSTCRGTLESYLE